MIKEKHIMFCRDEHCYCRDKSQSKHEFFINLAKTEVEEVEKTFGTNSNVLITALYLKATIYHDYP